MRDEDRTSERGSERIRIAVRYDTADLVRRVPVAALEVPIARAMERIGPASTDHGQIGRLRIFGAVACHVHTEFQDAFDGRKEIREWAPVPGILSGYAIQRVR